MEARGYRPAQAQGLSLLVPAEAQLARPGRGPPGPPAFEGTACPAHAGSARPAVLGVLLALLTSMTGTAAAAAESEAPGAPGASANWTTGNKQGLGTSVGRASKVWYTLADGALSEVYYPSGDTANVRSLEFAVTDGTSFVDRESEDTTHAVRLVDPALAHLPAGQHGQLGALPDHQDVRDRPPAAHRADARDVRTADARRIPPVHPLRPRDRQLLATRHREPARERPPYGAAGQRRRDGQRAGCVRRVRATSTGFAGTSDGWTDLADDHRMDWDFDTRDGRQRAPDRRDPCVRPTAGRARHHVARPRASATPPPRRTPRRCQPRHVPSAVAPPPTSRLARLPVAEERARGADRRAAHAIQRLGDDGPGPRGQDLPRRVHRLADPAVGHRGQRRRRRRRRGGITSSGRATSTSR